MKLFFFSKVIASIARTITFLLSDHNFSMSQLVILLIYLYCGGHFFCSQSITLGNWAQETIQCYGYRRYHVPIEFYDQHLIRYDKEEIPLVHVNLRPLWTGSSLLEKRSRDIRKLGPKPLCRSICGRTLIKFPSGQCRSVFAFFFCRAISGPFGGWINNAPITYSRTSAPRLDWNMTYMCGHGSQSKKNKCGWCPW